MKSICTAACLAAIALACPARAADDKTSLARQAQAILKTNCYRCHGQEGASEGGFNYVLDRQRLLAARKVVAGDPARSKLFKKLRNNEMPPEDETPRPSAPDVALIRKWIEAGAPDFNPAPAVRADIDLAALVQAIRDDLEQASERERPYLRYFTITHLYNAGWSEDELQSYRIALAKLVNSLSWGRRIVNPVAVDPARTILRIDLRDYKWSERIWDAILGVYPYGIDLGTPAYRYCSQATGCPLPYVRADWLVSAASRPPLYHDVLQLPDSDRELEKQLHIDVEEDIRQERVSRAGFNGSGVSRNNRVIERHETAFGAYWKSYDFASGTDRENIFEHPLGPTGELAFDHAGGEIIYSLPNGLQAYMLVDGKGNRLDKGPTAIVSDAKQADRAVVNGLSCMSCHVRGMIEKTDQIRESVLRNTNAFEKKDADTILALYKPKREMDKLFQEDAERFARAVAATGGRVDAGGRVVGSDPVVNLALLFEREVDLPLAAAEAGVKVDAFLKALEHSSSLARALGVLKVEGGTVQRSAFLNAFPDLVAELGIGVFLAPHAGARTAAAAANRTAKPGGRLFSRSAVVFLSDLPEFDVVNGSWPLTKDGGLGDGKTRIKVNGALSPRGLGMHPPAAPARASVKYRLGKQAALFKAIVAIDDTVTWQWTPAIFTILGDGKELFESRTIAFKDHARFQECTVDVSGVDVLELQVRAQGLDQGVSAVWVEPRLLQRADTRDVPWPPVKKLFEQGPRDYLTDLTEVFVKAGPWPLGKNGDVGNGSQAIVVNGQSYPKGLGLHPPDQGFAAVRYRLDRKATIFKGAVALNDSSSVIFGPAVFEVLGDGKRLWLSAPISEPRKQPQQFSINVSKVTVLELRVNALGSHHGLHAVWIDPRLLQRKDTPDK